MHAQATLLTPDAEPDHRLSDLVEARLRLMNTHVYLRQQADRLEHLAYDRELSSGERRDVYYAMASVRLALTCLGDAREWLERAAAARRGGR